MAAEEGTTSELELTDAEAEDLLADAVEDAADPKESEAATDGLGDAGKKALDALRAELRTTKAELRKAQATTREAKTLQQRITDMERELAERNERDATRTGRLALSQLNTRLAEAGIKQEDVAGLLKRISPADLLTDGEPDETAIGELADSLTRIAGRATPDPDQGKQGGKAPLDMNQLIRRAAGISQ